MLFLFLASMLVVAAQSTCPGVQFQNAVSASLQPTSGTQLDLVRQADGSYSSYEISYASPYSLLSISPHFERQLDSCLPAKTPALNPMATAAANPVGASSQAQAVALLASGNFLVVSQNTVGIINAAVFSPQMTLVSQTNYPIMAYAFALADVNGDGNPDIVYSFRPPESVPGGFGVLLGNGGSSFQAAITHSVASPYAFLTFAIGDLNSDHKLDIAIAVLPLGGEGGSIYTFLGNGDGTFQTGSNFALTNEPFGLAIADLNGDGKADLAVTVGDGGDGSGNYVAVALGNGDGSFATPSYTLANGGSLAIGDMNGDGNPDIVTVGTILFGDGKGSFPTRQDYSVVAYGAVILTDLDGDGRTDIVIAGGTPALLTGSTITVLFAQANGTFFAPAVSLAPGLAVSNSVPTDLRLADFNGDGVPDLVYTGLVSTGVMLGKGDGTFTSSFSTPITAVTYLATGDFNGDGKQDFALLVAYPPNQQAVQIFEGKGDGTFQAPLIMPLENVPAGFTAADFNGDGKLDLAVLFTTENDGTVDSTTIYLGNGDGTFRAGASFPTAVQGQVILEGDLNHDGIPDLIVDNAGSTTQIGGISTFLGKGDGTFVTGATVTLAGTSSGNYGPQSMTLADFNGDGKLDVAVALDVNSQSAASFAVLLGKGDGTFQMPMIDAVSTVILTTGDINGDGIPDLIGAVQSHLDLYVPDGFGYMLGNGDGTFQPAAILPVGGGGPMLVADVNRDGKADFLSEYYPLGIFSVLNLTGSAPALRVVSSASYAVAPVAPDSFVTIFGNSLPGSGVSIAVKDSEGNSRPATTLYASATQINFLMPAGTSAGAAMVNIASSAASVVAQADIVPLAPGLFTENAAGLAAAYAIRVDAEGNQTLENVFTVQNGVVVPTPISLGAATDRVYLCLFGTGFDNVTGNGVVVTVGGKVATVSYAGPQGTAGLDQVNVLLPASLAGSGDSLVVMTSGEASANVVHVTIQ